MEKENKHIKNEEVRPSHIPQQLWDYLTPEQRQRFKKNGYGRVKIDSKGQFRDMEYVPPQSDNKQKHITLDDFLKDF